MTDSLLWILELEPLPSPVPVVSIICSGSFPAIDPPTVSRELSGSLILFVYFEPVRNT